MLHPVTGGAGDWVTAVNRPDSPLFAAMLDDVPVVRILSGGAARPASLLNVTC
jgi:hypothetical protein